MSQTILYARVSTADQTAAHQRTQAEAVGYAIDAHAGEPPRLLSDSFGSVEGRQHIARLTVQNSPNDLATLCMRRAEGQGV